MAMASFVENVNIAMIIGIIRPPPPMPPTLASANRMVITIRPMNSV